MDTLASTIDVDVGVGLMNVGCIAVPNMVGEVRVLKVSKPSLDSVKWFLMVKVVSYRIICWWYNLNCFSILRSPGRMMWVPYLFLTVSKALNHQNHHHLWSQWRGYLSIHSLIAFCISLHGLLHLPLIHCLCNCFLSLVGGCRQMHHLLYCRSILWWAVKLRFLVSTFTICCFFWGYVEESLWCVYSLMAQPITTTKVVAILHQMTEA